MAVCAIRICVIWHHGFQTLPDPTVGCFSHTRTNPRTRARSLFCTSGLRRWMEFATLQWAFDARTMEKSAHIWHAVCARGPLTQGVHFAGALCPWAGRGVVGNSVPRDPENDVEVSCSERWWRFPYWHSHRCRRARWHRVNIADIKSPYTKPNLFCAWSLAWHPPLQRRSSGETKSSFVTRAQVLPSRQANRGETEVWSISCFCKGL